MTFSPYFKVNVTGGLACLDQQTIFIYISLFFVILLCHIEIIVSPSLSYLMSLSVNSTRANDVLLYSDVKFYLTLQMILAIISTQ